MYADFAGAKAGHHHMALGKTAVTPHLLACLLPLPLLRRCDQCPLLAVMSMDGRYAENAGAFFCGERTRREA